ncbi:type II secretion system protein E [Candidatus Cerribacteria bacterium 'Amazon FNV 2010 28 9']|uniref:Type II secretion system protein E n=1 Tax=Candidatus Cerribacteria bacterium 'Amazon FNV 2010 28 9' TaxID=2081795 RepID=A0A317JP84_9BACT|nr:MAG: type II secretion system protein E [Candidatus Cerribacteria bacterium 'Amazon FNV 2010 28 9']
MADAARPPVTSTITSRTGSVAESLLSMGAINQQQYDDLSLERINTNKSFEALIEEKQLVNDDVLAQAKSKTYGVPLIKLSEVGVSPEALSEIPQSVAQRYNLIPYALSSEDHSISIAMVNPLDLLAIDFVQKKTGKKVNVAIASTYDVTHAITERYAQSLSSEVSAALKDTDEGQTLVSSGSVIDINQPASGETIREAPIAKIVETILAFAVKSRASDVHIEPLEDHTRVRYRIDGLLTEKLVLPKSVHPALVSRIKILSELKIDEKRIPQDGRFTFRTNQEEVDLRVSTLPTVHGEKIVMRLLKKSGAIPTLQELGLRGTALKTLEESVQVPHGIILVTGPTGSGKTTTLYSVLHKINSPKVNIMTLEDPVEYQMEGINQVQINPGAGLTFASGLRSFLRQDPNIIMVGEIRDTETAELAIQAALTGHLVFSTLHTNSAAGALPRLLDMGAEPFLLSSSITVVMAQRVVRKITQERESYTPPPEVEKDIRTVLGPLYDGWAKAHGMEGKPMTLYRGVKAKENSDSGYEGRIAIFEVMRMNDKISRLVLEHQPANVIEKQAMDDGMLLMKQDGYLKALDGITTIEEVLRVAQI